MSSFRLELGLDNSSEIARILRLVSWKMEAGCVHPDAAFHIHDSEDRLCGGFKLVRDIHPNQLARKCRRCDPDDEP
jgi:hypothetical protein